MAEAKGSQGEAVGVESEHHGDVFAIEKKHISEITPEEFETKYVNRAMPIILQGILDTWPAYGVWNTEYFERELGEELVQVAFGKEWKKMTIKDYISSYSEYEEEYRNSGKPSPYLRTWNYTDNHPDFESTFDSSEYFRDLFKKFPKRMRPPFSWLFLGPQGVVTSLHEDIWHTDSWIAQLEGRKKFSLYHPGQRKHLEYVAESRESEFVDPLRPDLVKFPNFKKASAIEGYLEKGEILYIPRRWPHHAVGCMRSVSLTENFFSACNKDVIIPKWESYVQRRMKCEKILGRELRASDNLMKFCCHGGTLPARLVMQILGACDQDDDDEGPQVEASSEETEN